jgi:hypothetical protein
MQLRITDLPVVSDSLTVAQAQALIALHSHEGSQCPCCGQRVQLYERRTTSDQAAWLIRLVRLHEEHDRSIYYSDVDIGLEQILRLGGRYSRLQHAGLIVSPARGYWIPTDLGVAFAAGRASIPRSIYLYDGRLIAVSEERVTVSDCLSDHFSYEDLLLQIGHSRPLMVMPQLCLPLGGS